MNKKLTRRDFVKGIGVALVGAAIMPTLGGCSEDRPKQRLLVLNRYSEDENKVIASLAEGDHFGITRAGNIVDETNPWDANPKKYSGGTSIILPEETIQEDLEKLVRLFNECNEQPSEHSILIMKGEDDFEAFYFNGFEAVGNDCFNLLLDGLYVAKNINYYDMLLVGSNSKLYLDPMIAKEYGLEDKTEEITGKKLVKIA